MDVGPDGRVVVGPVAEVVVGPTGGRVVVTTATPPSSVVVVTPLVVGPLVVGPLVVGPLVVGPLVVVTSVVVVVVTSAVVVVVVGLVVVVVVVVAGGNVVVVTIGSGANVVVVATGSPEQSPRAPALHPQRVVGRETLLQGHRPPASHSCSAESDRRGRRGRSSPFFVRPSQVLPTVVACARRDQRNPDREEPCAGGMRIESPP